MYRKSVAPVHFSPNLRPAHLTSPHTSRQNGLIRRELVEMDLANLLTLRLLEDALRSNGETHEARLCSQKAKRLCAENSQAQQAVERELKWLRGELPRAK